MNGYFTEADFSDEGSIEQNRFKTYLNYLKALTFFSGNIEDELQKIASSKMFSSIQCNKSPDVKTRLLLRNAWLTEIQFNLSYSYTEFIPYTIHWAAVQAYYAIYLQLRTYLSSC